MSGRQTTTGSLGRFIRSVVPAVATALALLAISRDLWLSAVGDALINVDALRPADAIVPLAGERSRVSEAAQLFGDGYASWFVITEMWVADPNPAIGYVESVKGQAVRGGVPADRILIAPGTAASTYREALNLRRLAEQQRWRSLIVVTSPFHTGRARLILNEVFRRRRITLIVRPVRGHWYRPGRWWASADGREVTVWEYLKLALYLVGYHRLVAR
jgi:uncharacterized SAM-binding protein YcdF (DUF218 family)